MSEVKVLDELEEVEEEEVEEEEVPDYMKPWRYLARCYIDLQKLRMACQHRIRRLPKDAPHWIRETLASYYDMLLREEKKTKERAEEQLKEHPIYNRLYRWCKNVKGLGVVAALIFLGFIDPYKADTAGKAKTYFGVRPGLARRKGGKSVFNPEAKGKLRFLVDAIIMKKDEYYKPLYEQKKQYHLKTRRQVFDQELKKWVEWPPSRR